MFELTVNLRNSKGELTGKKQTFSSETAYGISCCWYKHVNSIPRKGGKSRLPDGQEAEETLKEVMKASLPKMNKRLKTLQG